MLPSKLGDDRVGGQSGNERIDARIGGRNEWNRRDCVVDGRVDCERKEPVGAVAEVGVYRSGVGVEF